MSPQPARILLVDDEQSVQKLLSYPLRKEGYEVVPALDGEEALERCRVQNFDLIVLDVMLPDGSGLDLCRDLRAQRSNVPIILLTALKEDVDRIIGLEIGADDYLGKPFNPRELIARVRAVLRRRAEVAPPSSEAKVYRFEGFTADPQTRRVTDPEGGSIELTGAEFDLLKTFLDRPGRVLSRDQLLDITRGREGDVLDRSIDVLVSRLRRKLGEGGMSHLFKTVRNGGYQLTVKVDVQDDAP
jgi:two-component system phosphate regulon response regulator OmpR